MFSVLALPILTITGFGRMQAGLLCATALGMAGVAPWRTRRGCRLPPWALPLAGAVAVLPVLALLPNHAPAGLLLAPPMFDHVKAALVDGIVRDGLPVSNPFVGSAASAPFAYYYLWHFSAAVLALVTGAGGWAADAAMAGATAWASVLLMMAVAQAIGRHGLACASVACLALAGPCRPVLAALFGAASVAGVLPLEGDLQGWLFQAAWVPQHTASACCLVLSIILMICLAERATLLSAPILGLVAAAGFESSTWIGGVTFAAVAPAVGAVLLLSGPAAGRFGFIIRMAVAAGVTAVFVLPFAATQLGAVAARGGAAPVALVPYAVLGPLVPAAWRPVLDVPAFWLLALPAGLPAIAVPGLIGIAAMWGRVAGRERVRLGALAAAILASLAVASTLRSTIDNNDLGWRAVLPAVLLLTAATGGLLARLMALRRLAATLALLACFAIGLPGGVALLRTYTAGQPSGDAAALARAPALWAAVRRVTAPGERVLNNPLFLSGATPWPDNISWGLMSDRPSCYAGWQAVVAYGALPKPALAALSASVQRVFAGVAAPGEARALVHDRGCRVFVLVPGDGAWARDPFAGDPGFRLVGAETDMWRIYRAQ